MNYDAIYDQLVGRALEHTRKIVESRKKNKSIISGDPQ